MSVSDGRRLLSGSILRITTLLTSVVVSFYIMPFLVHALGDRWYGFWNIAGSVVGYYSLLDLGLTNAAHRFLAVAFARNDRDETSRVFTTVFGLFCLGGVAAALMTGLAWLVVGWFVAPVDLPTIRMLVILLGANFALGFPMAMFYAVLAVNLRYDISCYLQLGKLALRTTIVVLAINHTPSIITLALVTLGTDIVGNIATVMAAWRLWPWLHVSRRTFELHRVRGFFDYGFFAFLIRIGDLVRYGVDNLVVAGFVSVASVTHYGIAMRLTDYLQELLNNAIGVLMPVFGRHHGRDEHEVLVTRVRQASRLAVALSVSVAGAAIIFGKPFIARWMGPSYVDAYVPLVILVSATLVGVMQTPSTAYLYAVARHKVWAGLNGLDAVANLGLSLLLAPRFGMIGVALGTMIPAFFVKLFLQPKYICGQLGLPLLAYWTELGAVFVFTAALQVPIAAVIWMIHPVSLGAIIGLAVPLYLAHSVALYLFALNDQDQSVLAKILPVLDSLLTIRRRVAALVTRSAS